MQRLHNKYTVYEAIMRQIIPLVLLALFSGALIPVQAAANGAMSKSVGSVGYTALVLFGVGFAVVVSYIVLTRTPPPTLIAMRETPLWTYIGGLVIATYVLTITCVAPRLGLGLSISLILAGQIVSAVIIDHFGLLRASVVSLTLPRAVGVLLIIAGVILTRRS